MKAILQFDLDDPDDAQAHKRCLQATDLLATIDSALQELRCQWKHGDHDVLNDYAQRISDIIYRELGDRGIDIND